MVAGHFGFAAAVKSRAPSTPLWALMLACQWLDVVFIPLFATGRETLVPVAGTTGGYSNFIIHADYTHSLLGALLLSLLFGAAATLAWGRSSGVILGAVVFSHWLLDLITHRPDLPLLPGAWGRDLLHLGFGLWQSRPATIAVELALVVGGALLYYQAARAAAGDGPKRATAKWAGAIALASGLMTLALDVAGS